jgi:membrane-associated phospholipid phosphatase
VSSPHRGSKGLTAGIVLVLVSVAPMARAAMTSADSSAYQAPRRESLLRTVDLVTILMAGAGVAAVTPLDQDITDHLTRANARFPRDLSRLGEHLGNPLYIAPVLGAAYLAGRLTGHPGVGQSALRIAGGIASASAVAGGLKFVVGRSRPYQAPDDPLEFRAFSGHTSFPSGHATVAFSLAAGIDQETRAGWVPYVVYPLAGLVGWSRIRDDRHWASDVLAGAVVGTWTARKFNALVRPLQPLEPENSHAVKFELLPAPGARGMFARATLRF